MHTKQRIPLPDRKGAIASLRREAKQPSKEQIQNDDQFMIAHMIENGISGPALIKDRRKPAYKNARQEQQRQEAEAAAANVLRHRIAANERRHPEIFAQVRDPAFLSWYEQVTGQQWEARFEGDIDEMRYRIIAATRSAENLSV